MSIFRKIFRGTVANDKTGDPLREGGQIVNDNFDIAEAALLDRLLRIDSVEDIAGLVGDYDGQQISILGYHNNSYIGGGIFHWDTAKAKTDHNGGTVIDPNKAFPDNWSNQTQVKNWFAGDGSGSGVWVRSNIALISPEMFGAIDTGDATLSIQKSADEFCSSNVNSFKCFSENYLVRKNNDLTGFPKNDQPCVLFRGKSAGEIDLNGAVFNVNEHAQGIIEIQQSSNLTIKSGKLLGPLDFPSLDGSTGRGEKGISSEGYDTVSFWGLDKNNSNNTASNTSGGFGGSFPQYGGGTASSWGTWNGGFIGNIAYGLLIHNDCHDITVKKITASGFNYVGIGVGHNGDFSPVDLGYAECTNVVFENCNSFGNYSAGAHAMNVDGFSIDRGSYNENGHPDADHTLDSILDPGYGFTNRGSSRFAKNVKVTKTTAKNNNRKGLDAHAGSDVEFSGNTLINNKVCGIFADASSATQTLSSVMITGNILKNNSIANSGANGSIYLGGEQGSYNEIDGLISNNKILNSGYESIRCRYASHVLIEDNKIKGSSSVSGNAHIDVLADVVERDVHVRNNIIFDNDDFINRGIQMSDIEDGSVSGNKVTMKGATVNIGIYTVNCVDTDAKDNSVVLGASGNPIAVGQSGGVTQGNSWKGGDESPFPYNTTGRLLNPTQADSFSFDVTFNGTSTPVVSNESAPNSIISASSIAQGLSVAFQNLPSVARYRANWEIKSSNGLDNDDPFVYLRSLTDSGIELGIKASPSSGHSAASTFSSGVIQVTIHIS